MSDNGGVMLEPPTKLYECQHCGRAFKHPGNFKQHLSSHMRLTGNNPAASPVIPSLPKTPIMKNKVELPKVPSAPIPRNLLPTKPQQFIGHTTHPHHQQQQQQQQPLVVKEQPNPEPCSTPTRWKCNHCPMDVFFQSREKLRQHVAANHRGPNAYKRPAVATAVMPNLANLSPVQPPITVQPAYHECNICHQVFESEIILGRHMTTHQTTIKEEDDGPFNCEYPDCFQSFSQEIWLTKHKENIHGIVDSSPEKEGEYECNICKKSFSKGSKLSAHMKIHSAPEEHYKFPCDICGKRFTRPQHVNRHKLLHTGERPFKCEKCDKSFAREDKYKIHIMKECEASSALDDINDVAENPEEYVGWASGGDEVSGEEEILMETDNK